MLSKGGLGNPESIKLKEGPRHFEYNFYTNGSKRDRGRMCGLEKVYAEDVHRDDYFINPSIIQKFKGNTVRQLNVPVEKSVTGKLFLILIEYFGIFCSTINILTLSMNIIKFISIFLTRRPLSRQGRPTASVFE